MPARHARVLGVSPDVSNRPGAGAWVYWGPLGCVQNICHPESWNFAPYLPGLVESSLLSSLPETRTGADVSQRDFYPWGIPIPWAHVSRNQEQDPGPAGSVSLWATQQRFRDGT